MKNIFKCNDEYFSKVDTYEKAYILGFLYADGNICQTENLYIITYGLIAPNKDIVYKITKALEALNPVHSIVKNNINYYYVNIHSKKMFYDLCNLGCIPQKSLTLTFPTCLPENLMASFILGYFDGDGCVWNGKRKKMLVKDSSKKNGYRERIVHNVKFTFTGNSVFIQGLLKFLVDNLGFKYTKLNYSKAKQTKHICTLEYSGRKQLKKLYDFMYKNASIFGNTKKAKFEEIFCASEEKSSEDTSLIAGTPEMVISSQASKSEEGSSTIPEMGVESSDSKCEAPNSIAEGEDIVSSAVK